jgi:hypothetical protein
MQWRKRKKERWPEREMGRRRERFSGCSGERREKARERKVRPREG